MKNEVMECIRTRRSVRVFSKKHVGDEAVRVLIEASQWAPSACNKQGWEFIVVRDGATKKRIVEEADAVYFIKNSPVVIYVLYRNDVTRLYDANIQSAAAAVQNMLLSANSLGLGSVWVCQCGERRAVKKILGIPGNLDVICAVCVGYPEEVPKPPVRKDAKTITHEERYGGSAAPLEIFPEKWKMEELMAYRENGIRAQSPTPESFRSGFPREEEAEAGIISNALKGKKDVLDVMPFSGNSLFSIIRKSGLARISAYETSPQVADFIKRKQKACGIKCDISFGFPKGVRLPYGDSAFDAVTCIRKLEMLPDPDSFMAELSRVTKPGGKVIVSFWNSRSVYGLNYFIKTRVRRDTRVTSNEGPVRPISKARVKSMLSSCGLRPEAFYGVNIFPASGEAYTTKGPLLGLCRVIAVESVKNGRHSSR